MRCKVLPSITTLGTTDSSWEDKLREIPRLGLREVSLFLTGLPPEKRNHCFGELEKLNKIHPFTIPFVHAVSTMQEFEFRYLQKVFKTERFNLHPEREYPLTHPLSVQMRKCIYIENSESNKLLSLADTQGFAGICLDVSHLEDTKKNFPEYYHAVVNLTGHITVGANHISAIAQQPVDHIEGKAYYSSHYANSKEEFSYLAELPSSVFGAFCAIEVENSLEEQLGFLPYIESIINSKVSDYFSHQAA